MDWQPIETAPRGHLYGRWLLLSWGGQIPQIGLVRDDGSIGLWKGELPFDEPPKYWMDLPKPPTCLSIEPANYD